ncbi:MAG TPA: GxxExxY protein [Kofleriaceae bacterium]
MERQSARGAKDATRNAYLSEPPSELDQLAHDVIGAAIEVHRELGPGFLEGVYEEALTRELRTRRIQFEQQVSLPVYYKGAVVAEARLDLLVAEVLVVELKAVEELRPVHVAQVLSYLRAGAFQLGLLFNFNVYSLSRGIRRVISSG